MIFKYNKKGEVKIDKEYKAVSTQFSLRDLNDLVYANNKELLENTRKKDSYFYSDIVASLYRKMFEQGLVVEDTFCNALLSCSYLLQSENYDFLAFIKRDDEKDEINSKKTTFHKIWKFKQFYNPGYFPYSRESKIQNVIAKPDFVNADNVFFVAGTQNFHTLNLRIKKVCALVSALISNDYMNKSNTRIILSGKNNAFLDDAKVIYTNESNTMQNLLKHKLRDYLNLPKSLGNDSFFEQILTLEDRSKNSGENIEEMINLLKVKGRVFGKLNLFIVSSTPHLLQLHDAIKSKFSLINEANPNNDIYLVGSENPHHSFKIYNASLVKYLMNEVYMRNSREFKFSINA